MSGLVYAATSNPLTMKGVPSSPLVKLVIEGKRPNFAASQFSIRVVKRYKPKSANSLTELDQK